MTTVRNDHLDLAAGRIDYTEFGPTDGPAVVFVHGFLVNQTVWGDIPQRLADAGLRCVVPTWPLGAHRHPMSQRADLSPRGVARLVIEFMDALRLTRVTLVGNDTGGAICQFVLDECGADGRLRPGMEALVERLVLTNCDAFDTFPPVPFTMLFALATRPRLARPLLRAMRWAPLRTSALGFGSLTARRLTAEETLPWVAPYLSVAGIALDVARFCGAVRPNELAAVTGRLAHFPGKSLLC